MTTRMTLDELEHRAKHGEGASAQALGGLRMTTMGRPTAATPEASFSPQEKVEAAAEWVRRDSLKPWARNPRKNDKAVPKVAASIKRFGFGAPILARRADREVIAGHTRLLAAESLGIEMVPVRFLDLDPADAHLLALADNKLNEKAEWDDAAVASLLSDYGIDDADLAGWDAAELDKIADGLAAEDAPPELGALEYRVVVDCTDETHQAEVLGKLEADGLKCRPLIS